MRAPWPGGSIATMPSPTKSDGVVNPERTILLRSVSGSISAARSARLRTLTFRSVPLPTGMLSGRAGSSDTPPARGHPHRLRQVYSAIRWLGHRRVPSLALFIEQAMPELAG